MADIEPPKPKSHLGRKRGVVQEKKFFSKEVKAKQELLVKLIVQNHKVVEAHNKQNKQLKELLRHRTLK